MKRLVPEPRAWIVVAALMAAVALPRLALLPFNENRYGDAISRTEMGERWMARPHLITAFGDGAGQYGPLHIYLLGLATAFADRELAGRVVSLLIGILTVVPLYRLARRLCGWQAGVVACLTLAVWGLHVQFSTTAASEALALFLALSVLDAFSSALDTGSVSALLWTAFWVNLASAVRYDMWMYPPVLLLAALLTRAGSVFSRSQWIGVAAAFAVFPLLWMAGNYEMHGDPFFPLTYINNEHREWVASDFGGPWRRLWLRAQGVGFWPAMAIVSLTPGVAALGALGMVSAWRERPAVRWLFIVAACPLIYYAVRISIFMDFAPLTRFMTVFLAVMLVFVWDGYLALVRWRGAERARVQAKLAVVAAVSFPVAIGAFTFRQDSYLRDVLRPLSPTSTNDRSVMAAAAYVRSSIVSSGARVVVDVDSGYDHVAVVFFSRLPDEQVIRIQSSDDVAAVERQRPEYVVRLRRGTLTTHERVRVDGPVLGIGETRYLEERAFGRGIHLYRRSGVGGPLRW